MPTFDTHSNFGYSTLTNAPGAAGTSFIVQTGDGARFAINQNVVFWPAGQMPLRSNAEIGRVTAISTDTLTITRNQESSVNQTVTAGYQISNAITAKVLTDIEAQFANYLPLAGGTMTGDITMNGGTPKMTASVTNAGLTMESTADTYGTVRLVVQNVGGVNGAKFTQAGSVDLVDFVFAGLANSRNIRYENRTGGLCFITNPEFQIGSPGDPSFCVQDHIALMRGALRYGNVANGSPTDGDMWYDSTQKSFTKYLQSINQYNMGVIFTQDASVSVTNTLTETTLKGAGIGTATLPANLFVAGKTIRIKARGYYSNDGTSGGNPQFKIKAGTTVLLDSGAISVGKGSSSQYWQVEGEIHCRTTGISGTVFSQGVTILGGSTGAIIGGGMVKTATTTIDTTATQALDLTLTWSSALAANTLTCTHLLIEVLD